MYDTSTKGETFSVDLFYSTSGNKINDIGININAR